MNSTPKPSLSRKEWYAALLFAHGATSNELANSLHVCPPTARKLTLVARAKLHVGSRSELRAALLAA